MIRVIGPDVTVETLLRQAQLLLVEADEANHGGHPVTYDLQRQARQALAEAIDQLGAAAAGAIGKPAVLCREMETQVQS